MTLGLGLKAHLKTERSRSIGNNDEGRLPFAMTRVFEHFRSTSLASPSLQYSRTFRVCSRNRYFVQGIEGSRKTSVFQRSIEKCFSVFVIEQTGVQPFVKV